MLETIRQYPLLFVVPALSVLSIANIPRNVSQGHGFGAFLSSCAALLTLMALFGIGMYPALVYSNPSPENSLTIYQRGVLPEDPQDHDLDCRHRHAPGAFLHRQHLLDLPRQSEMDAHSY